jgi:hypothetical protein
MNSLIILTKEHTSEKLFRILFGCQILAKLTTMVPLVSWVVLGYIHHKNKVNSGTS